MALAAEIVFGDPLEGIHACGGSRVLTIFKMSLGLKGLPPRRAEACGGPMAQCPSDLFATPAIVKRPGLEAGANAEGQAFHSLIEIVGLGFAGLRLGAIAEAIC